MPPSAFLSWVQETTFAGVPLGSLLIAVLAGVATYLGILLALSLLTGRARAWASQSHSGVARAMVDVLEGTSRFLMLVAALLVGASFLDLPGRCRWACGACAPSASGCGTTLRSTRLRA